MSLLSRLFGGGAQAKPEQCETYGEFRIYPAPIREGTDFRVAARIEADIDGETRTHRLIRADTMGDADQATEASISKARQVIDERGKRLFD